MRTNGKDKVCILFISKSTFDINNTNEPLFCACSIRSCCFNKLR
jgi:hypothetical protein